MSKQILVDFYGCKSSSLNDIELIKNVAREIVVKINSRIVEESYHLFEPYGITYIAIIAKSHIAIHTWPEREILALDVFSCDDNLPENFAEDMKKAFSAERYQVTVVNRL